SSSTTSVTTSVCSTEPLPISSSAESVKQKISSSAANVTSITSRSCVRTVKATSSNSRRSTFLTLLVGPRSSSMNEAETWLLTLTVESHIGNRKQNRLDLALLDEDSTKTDNSMVSIHE
ncbi:hypothetical protein BC936DRAFT_140885, partial [Jimgerdemannia flammicorona]